MESPSLVPRALHPELMEALGDTRVVLIAGPRQAGKSTLATTATAGEGRTLVTLDDATARRGAIDDPTGFIAAFKGPVLIDEVQRAPDLALAIKATVDVDQRPGRFLLTGSANFLTAPRIRDSLAGRIQIIRLLPLAQSEIERSDVNLVDRLFAGDPPRVADAVVGRDAFVEGSRGEASRACAGARSDGDSTGSRATSSPVSSATSTISTTSVASTSCLGYFA